MANKDLPGLWFLETLRRGGSDTRLLMRDFPEEMYQVLHRQTEAPADSVNRILRACAEMTGDENFGIGMNDRVSLVMYGVFGYLLLNAPTVRRLLEVLDRYYPLLYRGARFTFEPGVQGGLLRYDIACVPKVSPRHLTEWSLGFLVQFVRDHFDPEWSPVRVSFAHEPPGSPDALADLHRRLGPRIEFLQPRSVMEVDESDLELYRPKVDLELLEILLAAAEEELAALARKDSLEGQVRIRIAEQMHRCERGGASIASSLGMSESTLRRHLAREGWSLRALRDEVFKDLAMRALGESTASVSRISRELGYSEVSAFDRAFRRIAGQSPTAYRRARRKMAPVPRPDS
jgi:AraC-like DNA-binding protein